MTRIDTLFPAAALAVGIIAAGAAAAQSPSSWTGYYGGVSLSYHDGMFGNDDNFPGDGDDGLEGYGAGFLFGYNYQNGSVVYGGELSYAATDISGEDSCVNPAFDCGAEVDQLGSLRGRVGYLVNPQSLAYVTAGYAFADVYAYTDGPIGQNGENKRMDGWVYGLGFEQVLTSRINLRGALLRHDFAEADFDTDVPYDDIDVDFTTLEVGMIFRF
ncbi:outer membrane immunogenic protein [Roseivivax lentus]|uniref:Outer membrane immunogenic protein n=1 Tax=Roseivivax lentus TaxID=633194 RepID=A0A1N7MPX5_9RHOB|nr:outer membrane beta-barrel protein [Roseivivax lentus]SIS88206.1 outer membrane immunogenic protein [Roseivivax lentus]